MSGPLHVPVRPSRPAERGAAVRTALALAIALSLIAAAGAALLTRPDGSDGTYGTVSVTNPSPSPDVADAVAPSPLVPPPGLPTGPLPAAEAPGPDSLADLPGLPRLPGSAVVTFDEGIDGTIHWALVEYVTRDTTLDQAREHYRNVLRDGAWLVGDVDYHDGGWSFAASLGEREAQIEIVPTGGSIHTTVFVSDTVALMPPASPSASPSPSRRTRRRGPGPGPTRAGRNRVRSGRATTIAATRQAEATTTTMTTTTMTTMMTTTMTTTTEPRP